MPKAEYKQIGLDAIERMRAAWLDVECDEQDAVLKRMTQHELWREYWRTEIELLHKGNELSLASFAIKCDRAAWLFCKILSESKYETDFVFG